MLFQTFKLSPLWTGAFLRIPLQNIYKLSKSQNIFLVNCSVAFHFSYSSSLTNKLISEHFYSDEMINSYMYTGATVKVLFIVVFCTFNNRLFHEKGCAGKLTKKCE